MLGLRQAFGIVDDPRVATLFRDDFAKFLEGRLVADVLGCQLAPFINT